ncbi:MAG TPA: SPFH domain-containing protein, partial [Streptomyces sp.]|nr:SPFH domain-containing protein [Streptomyces sp.]
PIGCVGVVITLEGREPEESGRLGPRIHGHQGFRLPWVFLQNGGYRGVQEETLREGTICSLNPYFVRVVLVPTRILFLEWKHKTKAEEISNYDAHLEQIVATVEGYRLLVDMSQTLQIPATAAASLVSKFGDSQTTGLGGLDQNRLPVQRFVERVLGAAVETYFSQIAAEETVEEFISGYADFRTTLASRVSQKLEEWGVKALDTTLTEFRSEDPALNEVLKRAANERVRSKELDLLRDNAEREDAIDSLRERAENRRISQELKAHIDLLGRDNVMVIKMLQEITKAPVPQFIGGGDLSAFLETQPIARLEGLLDRMRNLNAGVAIEAAGNAEAPIEDKQRPALPETLNDGEAQESEG